MQPSPLLHRDWDSCGVQPWQCSACRAGNWTQLLNLTPKGTMLSVHFWTWESVAHIRVTGPIPRPTKACITVCSFPVCCCCSSLLLDLLTVGLRWCFSQKVASSTIQTYYKPSYYAQATSGQSDSSNTGWWLQIHRCNLHLCHGWLVTRWVKCCTSAPWYKIRMILTASHSLSPLFDCKIVQHSCCPFLDDCTATSNSELRHYYKEMGLVAWVL